MWDLWMSLPGRFRKGSCRTTSPLTTFLNLNLSEPPIVHRVMEGGEQCLLCQSGHVDAWSQKVRAGVGCRNIYSSGAAWFHLTCSLRPTGGGCSVTGFQLGIAQTARWSISNGCHGHSAGKLESVCSIIFFWVYLAALFCKEGGWNSKKINNLALVTQLLIDRKHPSPRLSDAKFSELSIKQVVDYKTLHRCNNVFIVFFCWPLLAWKSVTCSASDWLHKPETCICDILRTATTNICVVLCSRSDADKGW